MSHQPFGLSPENRVCRVAALEHGTTMPCALRLAIPIFRGNVGPNNFEMGSEIIRTDILASVRLCERNIDVYGWILSRRISIHQRGGGRLDTVTSVA